MRKAPSRRFDPDQLHHLFSSTCVSCHPPPIEDRYIIYKDNPHVLKVIPVQQHASLCTFSITVLFFKENHWKEDAVRYKALLFLLTIVFFLSINLFGKEAQMKISSIAFGHNGHIPKKYTCDGSDVNPPLKFEQIPANARSLALIVDDPDAPMGTWVHWVVWNIDPETTEIKENFVPTGSKLGMNDFGKHDYGGPCPPSETHRYFFKLYALDTILNISPGAGKTALESSMKGHILAEAQLIGLYKRSRWSNFLNFANRLRTTVLKRSRIEPV